MAGFAVQVFTLCIFLFTGTCQSPCLHMITMNSFWMQSVSTTWCYSKWFEPRSISSLSDVIVQASVVLKRTVGDSD